MDPFLEDPLLWTGFHAKVMAVIDELLVPQVRPAYWVDIEERVYIDTVEDEGRFVRPDASVSSTGRKQHVSPGPDAAAAPALTVEIPAVAEFREPSIRILRRGTREVVTVIEVLSPTNKSARGAGMASYLKKRAEVLHSRAHLIEIDLLREGTRPPVKRALPDSPYVALLHRTEDRPWAGVFPIALREPLPALPVPLGKDDPDVVLDLQRALTLTYDRGGYDVEIDYAADPVPRLSAGDREWACQLLACAGLRPEVGGE